LGGPVDFEVWGLFLEQHKLSGVITGGRVETDVSRQAGSFLAQHFVKWLQTREFREEVLTSELGR
jgi:xanthine/CO dehydrogenase XdhC/CoxF family maturation factor